MVYALRLLDGVSFAVAGIPFDMVTWLHLRRHHLWRTIKEVGLLSEDHLPPSNILHEDLTGFRCAALMQVRSICEKSPMSVCDQCLPDWKVGRRWANCDLLDSYGRLCVQKPGEHKMAAGPL